MSQPDSSSPGERIFFWTLAYKMSDALMVLEQHGALDHLAREEASAAELAEACSLDARLLRPVLDLLVSGGVLHRDGGRYRLPPAAAKALPMVKLERRLRALHAERASLEQALTSGAASDVMDEIDDPELWATYQDGMASAARNVAAHLVRFGGLRDCERILDLGGGDGSIALGVARHTGASGVVVDRPHLAKRFAATAEAHGLAGRVRFSPGDILAPESWADHAAAADGVIVSNVLHLLDADQIHSLLRTLLGSLPAGARVACYDQFVVAGAPVDAPRLLVVDWVKCGAGFDMTEADLEDLLRATGFTDAGSVRRDSLPGAIVHARVP